MPKVVIGALGHVSTYIFIDYNGKYLTLYLCDILTQSNIVNLFLYWF